MKSSAAQGSRNTQFELKRRAWQASSISFENVFKYYGAVAFCKYDAFRVIFQT